MPTPGETPPLARLRDSYPALARLVRGRPPIYLDSAATALKPQCVVDAVVRYYEQNGANVHRGIHYLSQEASEAFEGAREVTASFLGADVAEIVFVRNTTEAVNLAARSLPPGSRVVLTGMEHHSNLLPWRRLHEVTVIPLRPDGTLHEDRLFREIEKGCDLVAACHVSNVLGVVNPVEEIVTAAHAAGAQVFLDGAQAAPHVPLDLHALDCDYYALSAHKMGGPTGVGVLFGKRSLLSRAAPLLWGGNMITAVHAEGETLQESPLRHEAGTPAIEGALGLAAACDFLEDAGLERIWDHDRALARRFRAEVQALPKVTVYGPEEPEKSAGIVTFSVAGVRAAMVAKVLSDRANVCVRSGFLCSQPLHEALGMEPSVRASFYLYNTEQEIDTVVGILRDLVATA